MREKISPKVSSTRKAMGMRALIGFLLLLLLASTLTSTAVAQTSFVVRVRDPKGAPRAAVAVQGVPVVLLRGEGTCNTPQFTDADGLVLFAAPRHATVCNDRNNIVTDDPYTIIPQAPAGQECTFSTVLTQRFNVCTNAGSVTSYATASCSPFSATRSSSPVNYTLRVLNRNTGAGIWGASVTLNNGAGTFSTAGSGAFRISVPGDVDYTEIVSGTKFETLRSFTINPQN